MVDNIKNKFLIFLIFLFIYNLFNVVGDVILKLNEGFHYFRNAGDYVYFLSIIPAIIYAAVFQNKLMFVKKHLFFIIIFFPILFLTTLHFIEKDTVSGSSFEFLYLTIIQLSIFFELIFTLMYITINKLNVIEYEFHIFIVIITIGVYLYFNIIIWLTKITFNKINSILNKSKE